MDSVAAKVNLAVWEKLSAEDKKALEKVLVSSKNEKVLDFMNSKVKDFSRLVEDVTRQVMTDFRKKRAALTTKV